MKLAFAALLIAATLHAQSPIAAACGPMNTDFSVKLDSGHHQIAQPAPGKAQVYFIQDTGIKLGFANSYLYPTTAIGIDGQWVGAYKHDSFLSVSVDPGEHRLCTAQRSEMTGPKLELAHFTAQPGMTYFFRTRLFLSPDSIYLQLEPVDSDEARYLLAKLPLSVSKPKK
ncbi:MAG: hypothetical protein WBD67_01300 [Terracidiphilus sp.]